MTTTAIIQLISCCFLCFAFWYYYQGWKKITQKFKEFLLKKEASERRLEETWKPPFQPGDLINYYGLCLVVDIVKPPGPKVHLGSLWRIVILDLKTQKKSQCYWMSKYEYVFHKIDYDGKHILHIRSKHPFDVPLRRIHEPEAIDLLRGVT